MGRHEDQAKRVLRPWRSMFLALAALAVLGGCMNKEEMPSSAPPPAPAAPAAPPPPPPPPPKVSTAPEPVRPPEPSMLPESPASGAPVPTPAPHPAARPPMANGGGHPPPTAAIPSFPWPPPRYSAFSTLERGWVAPRAQATLGDAAVRLERAFDAAGYVERSYYRIPGGFALVSRIEHIRADATPFASPQRWTVDSPQMREGLIDFIRALFNAPPGFYRVIVFTVTDRDFSAREEAPTSEEAQRWVSGGALRLPAEIGAQPYSTQHFASALIYEFERRADQPEASVRVPSDSPGRTHLERAGLWQALVAR